MSRNLPDEVKGCKTETADIHAKGAICVNHSNTAVSSASVVYPRIMLNNLPTFY